MTGAIIGGGLGAKRTRHRPTVRPAVLAGPLMLGWTLGLTLGWALAPRAALAAAAAARTPPTAGPAAVQAFDPFTPAPTSSERYDREYPAIGYNAVPRDNAIARLQGRLDRGEVRLEFKAPRGYLDSLLAALDIDRSTQMLVFSKTSFQTSTIRAATPRAIYFNDDTYVGWNQGGELLELGAMDTKLGQVFYTLPNTLPAQTPAATPRLERETGRCLACHDTYLLAGGGVPRFLMGSTYASINGDQLTHEGHILTTDRTHLRFRWGGWYVTGRHGSQLHLGNVLVRSAQELVDLDRVRRGNIDDLDALFDTTPYLTNKSDIVALLVFQHQTYVQNLIERANFELRNKTPDQLAGARAEFLDPLVDAMLFVDAAPVTERITGNSGFDRWFEARGPRDGAGRSLRELDLITRLFRYPLSYLVYSPAFAHLPDGARAYVYERLRRVLDGTDTRPEYAHLTAADRTAITAILRDTSPEFVRLTATTN